MNRLRWQLIMFRRQIGWTGLLGLAGVIYATIYFFTTVIPAHQSLNKARQALAIARTEQATNPAQATVAYSPAEQLQNFTGNFPNAESINTTWEQISKLAGKSGLTIDHVLYESSAEKHAGLLRYHLNMPVKAAYPQIRGFLAEVIQTIPNAVLEQVNFKWESVDSPLVDASINLAIYVRAQ